MAHIRIEERGTNPFEAVRPENINREAGYIDNVLICGFQSKRYGWEYPAETFRRDYSKYEGKPANTDHAKESTVDRCFGWFSNVHPGSDGRPYGRLNVLKSHKIFEPLFEAAERNPRLFSFSHVALLDTKREGSRDIVTAIVEVASIDLVRGGSTTDSIFEGPGVATTVKEYLDKLASRLKLKSIGPARWLSESYGDAEMGMDAPAGDAVGDDGGDGIKAAFKAAMMSCIDKALDGDEDPKECLRKIKEMLTSHGKVNGDGGGGMEEEEEEEEEDDMPKESRVTVAGLIAEAASNGIASPTTDQLSILSLIRTKQGRKTACEGFLRAAKPPQQPRSGSGKVPAKVATEGGGQPTKLPTWDDLVSGTY